MKIVDIKATAVNIPYEAPTLACAWRKRGLTRTIIEIVTDEGLIGLGEVDGGAGRVAAIYKKLKPILIGRDPHDMEAIIFDINHPLAPDRKLQSGIEMALWDLMAKAAKVRVCDLIGGAYRTRIPVSGYLFFREKSENGRGGEMSAEAIVDQAQMLVDRFQVQCIKLKGGVINPAEEVKAMFRLREKFGPETTLRYDPNAIFSPEESIRIGRQMAALDLEWYEDPTAGIDGMSRVRESDPTPLATNMCVRDFVQLAAGIRAKAVDVVLGDPGIWGGIMPCKKLAAVCDTFSLGYSLHSAGEFGISTAAFLQIAASTPNCSYAIDTHLWFQLGDIVAGEPFGIQNGMMTLPDGPGLGVTLDPERMKYHAGLNQKDGDYTMEPIRHMRHHWWV
jgi:glucarate dehydratase